MTQAAEIAREQALQLLRLQQEVARRVSTYLQINGSFGESKFTISGENGHVSSCICVATMFGSQQNLAVEVNMLKRFKTVNKLCSNAFFAETTLPEGLPVV